MTWAMLQSMRNTSYILNYPQESRMTHRVLSNAKSKNWKYKEQDDASAKSFVNLRRKFNFSHIFRKLFDIPNIIFSDNWHNHAF